MFRVGLNRFFVILLFASLCPFVRAQTQDSQTTPATGAAVQGEQQESDPLKRPLTDKQKKANAKALQARQKKLESELSARRRKLQ